MTAQTFAEPAGARRAAVGMWTARRLGGLSKYTIHAWLTYGKLRQTKVGSRTMIRESELQRVIEDGGKSPSARAREGR